MITKAEVTILYEGKDITRDLDGEFISMRYTDKTEGEADELCIVIKDDQHKWKDSWLPAFGDKVEASIKSGGNVLKCGVFSVDDLTYSGSKTGGHFISVNALGRGVLAKTKTKTSFAHEGVTLATLAKNMADKYHAKVQGIIHNYSIKRETQFDEDDLAFMHRIAQIYGYIFTVRNDIWVFTYLPELSQSAGVLTVDMADVLEYSIRNKVTGVYVRGQNRYHNPKNKRLYQSTVDTRDSDSVNSLQLREHVDTEEEGLYKMDGRLYKKNLDQIEIECSIPGNTYCVAGVNVNLTGWYKYNGKFFISESTHVVNKKENYATSGTFKKIVENKDTGNAKGKKIGYSTGAGADKPISVAANVREIVATLSVLIDHISNNTIESVYGQLKALIDGNIDQVSAAGKTNEAEYLTIAMGQIDNLVGEKKFAGAKGYAVAFRDILRGKLASGVYD